MDELHLSDALHRYFCDIFLCCDEDKSGKASLHRTKDLIKSANIPEDVTAQIAELCWDPTTNYLSIKQFFSALKLVAAYQANLPVQNELITSKLDLPLPRFAWAPLDSESPVPDLIELRNEVEYFSDSISSTTDSEADSETLRCSPDVSSPASDSPTPTNSIQDRNWAWQGLVSEEQRQLLEEESSDKHSSDEDTEISNEVWVITPEQREYYTKQFKKLQENTNALIAGPIARTFFERSQLPVQELRKIWQLSDVSKDGALSLQEFFTAMHLVVLRKHKIPIPDVLPPSLIPKIDIPRPPSPQQELESQQQNLNSKETAKEWTKFVDSPTSSTVSSPGIKPVNFDFQIDQNDPDLRHPVPRRLTPEVLAANAAQAEDVPDAIDLNSPKKQEGNHLQVLQQNSAIQRPQPKKLNSRGPGAIPPPPEEGGPVSLPAFPPLKKEKPPPPPPRPIKTHGRSSSLDLNKLNRPNAAPPVVPPRVSPSGQQSKFLINQKSEGDGACNMEDKACFANFEQYENVQEDTIFPGDVYEAERKKLFAKLFSQDSVEEPPKKHGAFEVYRKPGKVNSDEKSSLDALEEEQWEEFERLQIENTALLRTCQELSQELADVKEEKMLLKVQLERLQALQNGG